MEGPQPFIVKYAPFRLHEFCCKNDTDIQLTQYSEMDECSRCIFVLKTLIDIDDINILLTGGPNSGKTSMLQSIIREYYGLSKGALLSETNVLIINNLKEQGIQFFRNEMKTFCQTHCTIEGKKKTILIDDIDRINKQSQQVFRNYIDKYKSHICVLSYCSNSSTQLRINHKCYG
jgi:DNA polymerase III delta prime subunit